MFDLENLNYSVENENVIGFKKKGAGPRKSENPCDFIHCSNNCAPVHLLRWMMAKYSAAWSEGICLKSFLGSSWRKSLIKNFRWLLPFLFVNKEASEEVSEVFTQKRKWGQKRGKHRYVISFRVLKEHKDVVREILSGFSLFSELFGSTSPTIIFSLNGRLIGVLAH